LLLAWPAVAHAGSDLKCGSFTKEALVPAQSHDHPYAIARMTRVVGQVKSEPYRALFFGDSTTEGWPPDLWQQHFGARGVLNVAVAGDGTEHLRWRLEHGLLDGKPPELALVMIGTNDLGRPPEVAAEGVRAIVAKLRERWPGTRILLLGILPRGATPDDPARQGAAAANKLLQTCADGRHIVFADIGSALLDKGGALSTAASADGLHPSPEGYARLAPRLDALLDRYLPRR
jgi:lysophospholipase L1-like esterase